MICQKSAINPSQKSIFPWLNHHFPMVFPWFPWDAATGEITASSFLAPKNRSLASSVHSPASVLKPSGVGLGPGIGWRVGENQMNQWIGLREKLEPESPIFNGKIYGFRLKFSLKPIHWMKQMKQKSGKMVTPIGWDIIPMALCL